MEIKIGIIGGGSWATALSKILNDNKISVNWWMRDGEQAEHLVKYGHNPKYISSASFDTTLLNVNTDLDMVLTLSDVLIIATPSAFLHDVLKGYELKDKHVVSAIKGIIPQTNEIPLHYFEREFGVPQERMAVICGPCHAEEVAMENLSYLTLGSTNTSFAKIVSNALDNRYIRCSTSADVLGLELCAIMKNIYALAAGICHGLGYGDNFLAVLISNAIKETELFLSCKYPNQRNIVESGYLGDLLVTAYSPHSRNRRFGNMIGKGYSVMAIQQEMNMVAEGYYASKCLNALNKENIHLPIAGAVFEVLHEQKSAKETIRKLCFELY